MKVKFTFVAILSFASISANATKIEFINKSRFHDYHENICIDGEGSTKRAWKDQNVQSYHCDGGPDQSFYLYIDGQRYNPETNWFSGPSTPGPLAIINQDLWFEIRPSYYLPDDEIHPSLCLEASGYSGKQKANVQFWTCQNLPDQKWKLTPDGQLINKQQGMCLDIRGYSGKSNINMQLYRCDGYLDQSWWPKASY